MTQDDSLDAAFSALAHPTRRAIVARLARGDATVNQLAEPFAMSLPAISKHIRVLEAAKLVEKTRDGQFRPCRLTPGPLREVAGWTSQYRPIWEARFDRMQEIINEIGEPGND